MESTEDEVPCHQVFVAMMILKVCLNITIEQLKHEEL